MGTGPLEEGGRPEIGHVRAFFGLPVPEAQRAGLTGFIDGCAAVAPRFRWTPIANLHVTVRFIGSADQVLVDGIADRLAARSLPGFDVEAGELGTFRRGRLVRVVWLGLRAGAEAATRLAAEVDAECSAAGFESEKRSFQAHVTLARARPRDGDVLPALPDPPRLSPWRATELVLYASRLGRAGAVYEPLRVLRLD